MTPAPTNKRQQHAVCIYERTSGLAALSEIIAKIPMASQIRFPSRIQHQEVIHVRIKGIPVPDNGGTQLVSRQET